MHMPISEQELEQVGEYVRKRLAEWIAQGQGQPALSRVDYEMEMRERIVRVEEELKSQRELMKQGFELMEKRFEQVDKRFEQVDKRFEQVDRRFEQVDKRFEQVDRRFEEMNTRLIELTRRMSYFMVWSFGFVATVAGVVIAVMKL